VNILNPIKISYKYLLAAKLRSFLTILGIIIGVAVVPALLYTLSVIPLLYFKLDPEPAGAPVPAE
jgi:hypothetical protein